MLAGNFFSRLVPYPMSSASDDLHRLAGRKAGQIEAELKRLNFWKPDPPPERFADMGPFGSKTMGFEQWLQFVLIPRIREIVHERGEFPAQSSIAPYAVRYFDGHPDPGELPDLLCELDCIINSTSPDQALPHIPAPDNDTIPEVIHTLVEVLPQFEGDDLESQLQTYDSFLATLSGSARPVIAGLLEAAAKKCPGEISRLRIEEAAASIRRGGRAAEPYDHAEAMRKYREEFKKNFPDSRESGQRE